MERLISLRPNRSDLHSTPDSGVGGLRETIMIEATSYIQGEAKAHDERRKGMEAELHKLTSFLSESDKQQEADLRQRLLSTVDSLFATRKQRATIVLGYWQLYAPLKRWKEFCSAAKIPVSTSYDLIKLAGGTPASESETETRKSVPESPDFFKSKVASLIGEYGRDEQNTTEQLRGYLLRLGEHLLSIAQSDDLESIRQSLTQVKTKQLVGKVLAMPKPDAHKVGGTTSRNSDLDVDVFGDPRPASVQRTVKAQRSA